MIEIAALTLSLLQSVASPDVPAGRYACEGGKTYAVSASAEPGALSISRDGLPVRLLINASTDDGIVRFSDGGLTVLRLGDQILIGAPELETTCRLAP
jgi:hypothetical protein